MRWVETRACRRLTWPARLLITLALLVAVVVGARHLHDFLAPVAPLGGDYLVVEGWIGDDALARAAELYRHGTYRRMLITGARPYRNGIGHEPLSHADIAAHVLKRLGMQEDDMVLIGSPKVRRDRTYTTALAVRDWFGENGIGAPRFDLASEATHAARSHLLYRMAFGDRAEIGVIALPRDGYDPARWWASSAGTRSVLTELLGYLYVKLMPAP